MKRHKILIPVLFTLFFFLIFIVSSIFMKEKWEHSSAEDNTTTVENNSSETLLTVNTTFYNYRYDKEIYDGVRDQGAQSCYDGAVIPFGTFDQALSDYYKSNKVKMGIYSGNFYMYYGGLEGVGANKLEFPGYYNFRWAANIANRNSPYNSVCQGIVSDTLKNFDVTDDTSGTLMAETSSGQVSVPYFSQDFLNQKVNSVAIGAVKENVGFPFRKVTSGSKKGYYEFDSTKDVVRFKDNQSQNTPANDKYYFGSEGKLQYYYNQSFVYSYASNSPQFLPYNQTNTKPTSGTSSTQKALDYGFGIRFNIPFYLSEDGTINGKNMVFEFSGDDDVWIFLDGQLVLDLGGQHGAATGTIDFGGTGDTIKVTNKTVTYVNGSTDALETVTSDKILAEDTYVNSQSNTISGIAKGDTNKHVLTIFYMERGMFESNFHMTFNFVPEGVAPTETPEPTNTPNADAITDGSLTIQNEMVFPTTTPDTNDHTESKINSTFLETVKDLAEDDVFQYSIQNKGTQAEHVGDSEIKYPSGVLTVRENGSDTIGKKKSYLSFGPKPYVRVYFDLSTAKNLSSDNNQKQWGTSNIPHIQGDFNGWKHTQMIQYNNTTLYYYDVELSKKFKFTNGTNDCLTNDITASSNFNGRVFTVSALGDNSILTHNEPNTTGDPPYPTSDAIMYSYKLPYQDAGTDVKKYTPADSSSYYAVADTSYELREAYLAPTDSNILINEELTSGITDENGYFGLFYDDSATFRSQFAAGSQIKVVQESTLLTPTRYSGTLSSSMDANTALTTFTATTRKTSDYYYTTVRAQSKSADGTATESIDVSYDGQYSYSNGATIPASDPVDITQTFTNTVKTGSLTISKELKGNMDADSNHSYGFIVTFSNVFGGSSAETLYSGSYTLIQEDGTETSKTTTTGQILLKPNQKATISGIPVDTAYKITEVATDGSTLTDGSVVSEIKTTYEAQTEDDSITSPVYKETDSTATIEVDKENRTISGIIPCSVVDELYGSSVNEFAEVHVSIAYTNQFGALSITKKIAGDVNNSTYYGTNTDGTAKIQYTFTVLDGTNPYQGDYLVYTYTYEHGPNMAPTITSKTKSTTDGTIVLKEGQKAEIGGISLSGSDHNYTIEEEVKDDDIFFVEQIKVTTDTINNSTIANATQKNAGIELVLNSGNPSFDVVYSNRYSNAYLTIEKFVDKVYYDEKEYTSGLTYQQLTDAKQSFIFNVKQYKTLTDAEAGNDQYESSFEIVLSMGENSTELSTPETFGTDGVEYNYKLSKTIQVLGNRYYRIEEDTNWSWKYELNGVACTDSNSQSTTDGNVVILKGYLDTVNELENKDIPVAKFYNSLNSDVDLEGDTDNVINNIKLPKTSDLSTASPTTNP